ncbi:MAG TPA: NUDIX domain-containing protein [Cellulomonas sp.]|uniref:NUDIX domain-containing protein n=1 Tax=Cellulomonas sp. TaxID=40001 RepID=UPI002E31F2FC|nr:NUDIX domain-containing protein [Cellulomonas sp.]HEX5332349.1 NUDIX domain-containing protein [Cellulomonas sp.]
MKGTVEGRDRATRVAAYALCVDDDRVLLERWRSPSGPAWTLPGGALQFGEDPPTAVRREVLARTSLVVEVRDVLGIDSWRASLVPSNRRSASTDTHAIRIVYAGRIVGGLLDDDLDASAERFGWVRLEALPHQLRAELVDSALAWAAVGSLQ